MGRRSTWVAWSMLAVVLAGYAVGVPLSAARGQLLQDSTFLLAFAAFTAVGALIVAHRPGNAVGWIFTAIGLLTATGWLATEYAARANLGRPGARPGGVLAAWYTSWYWYPTLALVLVFTLLLFPTGRLPSARWRPVAVAAAVATVGITALWALKPTLRDEENYTVRNPIGLAWVQDPEQSAVGAVLYGLLLVCMVAAGLSLVLRFRRSHGVERQQLKWFTYAATLLILSLLAGDYLLPASSLVEVLAGLIITLVPVAAGIAILRYRLYDIDRLINRTLVYGTLTAVLGCCYVAGSLVFVLVAGAGSDPPGWLIAAATLTAAAVFRPARRRIQAAVDRRFNRRRYNATKTIQAFSTRLRDQIDLDTLSAELLVVVDQTMEPTSVSLWLRPTGATAQAPGRHG